MKKTALLIAMFLLMLPALAQAHHYQLGDINIGHVWARDTNGKNGAVYIPLINTGNVADALTSAETPVAGMVMFHQTNMVNGVASMKELSQIELPTGKTVNIAPGKMHLMLMDLKKPLKDGDKFPLTLHFAKAGMIEVEVHVQKAVPTNDELSHEHHH